MLPWIVDSVVVKWAVSDPRARGLGEIFPNIIESFVSGVNKGIGIAHFFERESARRCIKTAIKVSKLSIRLCDVCYVAYSWRWVERMGQKNEFMVTVRVLS